MDTELQAGLLWRLGRAAGDPDADDMYCWLTQGAPAGIEVKIEDAARIFPASRGDEEPEMAADYSDPWEHTNYSSVDEDPHAAPEVERLIATGFVKATRDWRKLAEELGGWIATLFKAWDDRQGEGRKSQASFDSRLQGIWCQQESIKRWTIGVAPHS